MNPTIELLKGHRSIRQFQNRPIQTDLFQDLIKAGQADEKQDVEIVRKVTVIAIIIPRIPKRFPCLDVSGEDKPLSARIKSIPETK